MVLEPVACQTVRYSTARDPPMSLESLPSSGLEPESSKILDMLTGPVDVACGADATSSLYDIVIRGSEEDGSSDLVPGANWFQLMQISAFANTRELGPEYERQDLSARGASDAEPPFACREASFQSWGEGADTRPKRPSHHVKLQ